MGLGWDGVCVPNSQANECHPSYIGVCLIRYCDKTAAFVSAKSAPLCANQPLTGCWAALVIDVFTPLVWPSMYDTIRISALSAQASITKRGRWKVYFVAYLNISKGACRPRRVSSSVSNVDFFPQLGTCLFLQRKFEMLPSWLTRFTLIINL